MRSALILALLTTLSSPILAADPTPKWPNGPSTRDEDFPIAVWLQSPSNAARYREIGINTYVGLWRGPSEEQLAELERHHMQLICRQNLKFVDRKTIVGWMHNDEPDNAQELRGGKGYGPPVATDKIVADYKKLRNADPTRPVFLNLGQGVAYDNYIGRGVRRRKMEDYPLYVAGCDIASFDIYPVNENEKEVSGKLELVPRGVSRLVEWTKGEKPVWNCIECGSIHGHGKPTPQQVRSEVWMSIIHGSRGLIYFVHQLVPKQLEAGLLADREMSKAVGEINAQVKALAPVIHSRDKIANVKVASSSKEVTIDVMAQKHSGSVYLFAAAMRNGKTTATFTIPDLTGKSDVEVIGESRQLTAENGRFDDQFDAYSVHLYRLNPVK